MRKLSVAFILIILGVSSVSAQAPSANSNLDAVLNGAINQENVLLKTLREMHPIAETYIQDLQKDADFGTVPKTDHYFLGKVDLTKGVSTESFIPKSSRRGRAFAAFSEIFSVKYLPRGFAQMMLIDGSDFNRDHYDFEFVRREFLGDVRTYVVSVTPKKEAGSGRFIGRIWIEDKGFNIVRFNGTYNSKSRSQFFMHFDSWRVNTGPDLWIPAMIYSEESAMPYALNLKKLRFKALTHLWGYAAQHEEGQGEFTNMTVDLPSVQDKSDQAADNSPVESLRAWERQSEDNVLHRMEKAAIVAPVGEVEKVLDTVVNNMIVTNNLTIVPDVRTRVILTEPLETFSVGHTIVISRGLLDTLPDEPSLAAILAHELAHIALGQQVDTKFAFSDRVLFDDEETLKKFRFARTQQEEDAANTKAIELLQNSPYKDKLGQAGLFLKAMGAEADRLPNLIKPLFGSKMADKNNVTRLAGLIQSAPELQKTRLEQIAALPLGARTKLDPWTDRMQLTKARAVPLLSAREKMPFELAPIFLHLTRQSETAQTGDQQPAGPAASVTTGESAAAAKPAQQ